MTEKPIRWGVVATGVVSASFAKALGRVPGNAKYAVLARDPRKATQFAKEFGFERALGRERTAFSVPEIDVFYIASPTSSHHDLCRLALEAGKPFLCEKPMTASLAEFDRLQSAVREAGVFAMEAMWLRFNPLVAQLRMQLEKGSLGEILSASMQVGYAEFRGASTDNTDPSRDALSVFGCYGFSLALLLFGNPLRVIASGRRRGSAQAVEHAHIVLAYPRFSFQLETSIVANTRNAFEVLGSHGRISIPVSVLDPYRLETSTYRAGGVSAKVGQRLNQLRHAVLDQVSVLHPLRGSGFRGEIAEVANCLRSGQLESRLNPLSATRRAQQIQQAVRESLHADAWRSLDELAPDA